MLDGAEYFVFSVCYENETVEYEWYKSDAAHIFETLVENTALNMAKTSLSAEEDGGVTNNSVNDAPKTVESEDITEFYCRFVYEDIEENNILPYGTYILKSKLAEENAGCEYSFSSSDGEETFKSFVKEKEFLQKVNSIVKKYDFASLNGHYCSVSGLPDDYGFDLDINYLSGEYISASDNQDCYIPVDAMYELVELFK